MVSQPWNERFPGHPLPYFDAVRGATDTAWILVDLPGASLPHPRAFESTLASFGEHWQSARIGALSVYYGFSPPLPDSFRARLEEQDAPRPGSRRTRPAPSRHTVRR